MFYYPLQDDEEAVFLQPSPKPTRQPPEVKPKPQTTPVFIASAEPGLKEDEEEEDDDEEEDKFMKELQVKIHKSHVNHKYVQSLCLFFLAFFNINSSSIVCGLILPALLRKPHGNVFMSPSVVQWRKGFCLCEQDYALPNTSVTVIFNSAFVVQPQRPCHDIRSVI